ncbi:MAG: MFS transporter [Alphaproteobacteria bacterium]|nr:MFS transporter [Alphaproteobacteria bacterium]MBU6472074.1 MFS transporter [Alphaproteobacteria bacterium]MDE2014808.1 MFS transporter [Alphaproteobacteria bacterium]MDE2073302.1 MFS transporter [Alphaproteobacteria bacterium]MDE2351610.1 MFS transporter [Alphaproteobacteria bacterium]
MTQQIRALAAILFSTLIYLIGNGLLNTIIPVRGDIEGFSNLAIGAIGSAYYLGFVLGCYIAPRMLASSGHIRTFAVGAAIAASMTLLQSLAIDEIVWAAARAFFGFSAACMYMVIESWLNDRAENETRGRIFAAYLTVNFAGIVIGQWLYVTAPPTSFVLFNLSAIFYALCLVPVGLTRLPQPQPAAAPVLRPLHLFKLAPVGVAGCAAVGFANGAVWTLAPVYAHSHGLTNGLLAAFMSAFTLMGAIVQVPVGRLSDHMDRRYVIAAVSALAAVAGLLLAWLGGLNRATAIAIVAVYGAVTLPVYGLSVAHANDRLPRDAFVETSATLLLVNALASAAGPLLAAFVTTWLGTAMLFVYTAVIHGALAAFALVRTRMTEAPPEEFHEPFAPVLPTASQVALELDPRGPESEPPAA